MTIKFLNNINSSKLSDYFFVCPHCTQKYYITYVLECDNSKTYYIHSADYGPDGEWIRPTCDLFNSLYDTDKWQIRNINHFKARIRKYFTSNEYITVLKQEILKEL